MNSNMGIIGGFCFLALFTGIFGITFNNGRYEDINIIVQDSVEENETLIERIKEVFTAGSQFLFEASKHHVYFGQINIIIPKNWTSIQGTTLIPASSAHETYITVEQGKVKSPHTKRKKFKCGMPGWYIYLPPSFLLTEGKTKWGYHANVIVHEWGHFRWGLFDEYGTKKGRFYLKGRDWSPVRCNDKISGTIGLKAKCKASTTKCDATNGRKVLNESCRFCPHEAQSYSDLGSIMSYQYPEGVTFFCDSSDNESVPEQQRHNKNAPSKQNLKCKLKSAWEVMREHDDFKAGTLNDNTTTTPSFQILQETDCYRVFVLDVSGSMNDFSRIEILQRTSALMIQDETLITNNSFLGIVWFEGVAYTTMDVTQVTSKSVRNNLITALPAVANGGTCIGCGIDEALRILTLSLGNPSGSQIIVISDGMDNIPDVLSASIQSAITKHVTLHTVAVSQAAETTLQNMAIETGGKFLSYLDQGSISLGDAFSEVLSCGTTSFASESTKLVSEKTNASELSFDFDVDSTIGKSTSVTILKSSGLASMNLEIVSPDGTVQTKNTPNGNSVRLDLPGVAKPGKYEVKATCSSSSFEYYVSSSPTESEVLRVIAFVTPSTVDFASGQLPVIQANVLKGRAPVLYATVTALVESGTGTSSCKISLLDNGAEPDDTVNDGTYNAVIPGNCLSNGRITTKVYARGENGSASVLYEIEGAISSDSDEDETNSTETLTDNFQRTTVTDEIQVDNYDNTGQDITAPGRITDVDIIGISSQITQYGESRNFTITWTATGDDVNVGQAIEYELRISGDIDVLANNFSQADLLDVVNSNFTPKAAGETEYIRLEIDAEKSYTSTTFLGVRAKDEAGNSGDVSNIVSILVAERYRIKVEGDVVYSYTEEGIEEYDVQEKKKNFTGLAIGLSSAAVVIIVSIIAAFVCLKKLKAKESVEDSEFGSRASTTTVFSIDKPLKELFTSMASRQTVAKKTFMSSQLPTIPEREQIWTNTFSKRPISPYSRKPFDIISQGECSIEMLNGAANDAFVDQMEGYLNVDNDSIYSGHMSSRISCSASGQETTNKSLVESESDILPGESTETQSDVEKNQCKFLSIVEGFANENERQTPEEIRSNKEILPSVAAVSQVNKSSQQRKKGFKRELRDAYSEERSVTCSSPSVDFPAFDSNEISREISKMYEDVHFEQ